MLSLGDNFRGVWVNRLAHILKVELQSVLVDILRVDPVMGELAPNHEARTRTLLDLPRVIPIARLVYRADMLAVAIGIRYNELCERSVLFDKAEGDRNGLRGLAVLSIEGNTDELNDFPDHQSIRLADIRRRAPTKDDTPAKISGVIEDRIPEWICRYALGVMKSETRIFDCLRRGFF